MTMFFARLINNLKNRLNRPPVKILDGRVVRDSVVPKLIEKVAQIKTGNTLENASTPCVPTLAIIQVGDRPDSNAFIRAKKNFAKKIGINERHIQMPEISSEYQIIETVKECNVDPAITGIIVQLPLPDGINRDSVITSIDPRKDVDGLTPQHLVIPATARGIKEMLAYYDIPLANEKVTVIGRSALVGTPIAEMCRQAGAVVTVCHSKTPDLAAETTQADIVISATGKIGLVRASHIKEGAVVIDVGISRQSDGTLTGDVHFDSVKSKASAISPVPGGVGPMTVCALFENLMDLCK